ncbi:hypothetical protein FQN57_003122 [Myotisia sp. PD_48]|nr:hypothetical protein FQN57_003122 [Myotisia sp. PD_48]
MGAVFQTHQPFNSQQTDTSLPSFELPNPQQQPLYSKFHTPDSIRSQDSQSKGKTAARIDSKSSTEKPNPNLVNVAHSTGASGQNNPGYWANTPSFAFNAGRGLPPSTLADNLSPYHLPPYHSGSHHPNISQQQPLPQSQEQQPHSPRQHSSNQDLRSGSSRQPQPQPQPLTSQPMAQSVMDGNSNHMPQQISQQQHSNSLDPYGQRLRYAGVQQAPISPHSPNFQAYPGSSVAINPPITAPPRMASVSMQGGSVDGQQPLPQYSRPYPSYSLPAMSGPVMSNVHHPSSQMTLIGSIQPNFLHGYNSGHAASLQQMYANPHSPTSHHMHGLGASGPPNDRPFRCDLCPQSFNRNHDLKRHKRIHLAVKPFPCTHCDKSFSRKDALKRHIVVKGCGKDHHSETDIGNGLKSASTLSLVGHNKDDDANSSGTRGTTPSAIVSRHASGGI